MYLIYSYQYNKELVSKGLYRGHDEQLLGHYRRECLLVRQHKPEHCDLFETTLHSVTGSFFFMILYCHYCYSLRVTQQN